ncbi:MAG: NfeD family protein [Bacteroidales bacterium]|jgi:membrane-bound ClpP family serine protease|nr:NfeD family protein [Bacteroidales bacterium]
MWSVIIILILVGYLLLLLEILVIPGTGLPGIVGFGLMVAGIWIAYRDQGMMEGHITLTATLAMSMVGVVLALRSKTWKSATLTAEIDGKAGQNTEAMVKVGDYGITISRCTPGGTAEFNNQLVEVTTLSEFIDPQRQIEIVKISGNKIIVKQIT